MKAQADKTVSTKSKAAVNKASVAHETEVSEVVFEDKRPEVVAQQQLAEKADSSPQAGRIAQLQAMADAASAEPVQLQELKGDEDLLEDEPEAVQRVGKEEAIQTKSAVVQKKEEKPANNTGLPDTLKSGIEGLSGLSMDDVKVHYNSAKPAQLQAHAFAQGTDIHMAPGQEKHLPHEAWHVVQQKQGRVKPTMQMKGKVGVNDDVGLEKEAELMGEKAAYVSAVDYSPSTEKSISEIPSQFVSNGGLSESTLIVDGWREVRKRVIANGGAVAQLGKKPTKKPPTSKELLKKAKLKKKVFGGPDPEKEGNGEDGESKVDKTVNMELGEDEESSNNEEGSIEEESEDEESEDEESEDEESEDEESEDEESEDEESEDEDKLTGIGFNSKDEPYKGKRIFGDSNALAKNRYNRKDKKWTKLKKGEKKPAFKNWKAGLEAQHLIPASLANKRKCLQGIIDIAENGMMLPPAPNAKEPPIAHSKGKVPHKETGKHRDHPTYTKNVKELINRVVKLNGLGSNQDTMKMVMAALRPLNKNNNAEFLDKIPKGDFVKAWNTKWGKYPLK